MSNFFHAILGKVAMGFLSLALFFGASVTPHNAASTTAPQSQSPVAYNVPVVPNTGTTSVATTTAVHAVATIKQTCSIAVTPTVISQGDSAVLSWRSTGAAWATINWLDNDVGVNGSQSVSPTKTTNYIGSFYEGKNMVQCDVTLTVLAGAPSIQKAAVPLANPATSNVSPSQTLESPALKIAKCQAQAQTAKTAASLQWNQSMSNMNNSLKQTNPLVDQKNAVMQAILGNHLDAATLAKLPSDVQNVINGGNRDALLLQAQALDDAIAKANTKIADTESQNGPLFAQAAYDKIYSDCLNQ